MLASPTLIHVSLERCRSLVFLMAAMARILSLATRHDQSSSSFSYVLVSGQGA
jgi:hypothetical protein